MFRPNASDSKIKVNSHSRTLLPFYTMVQPPTTLVVLSENREREDRGLQEREKQRDKYAQMLVTRCRKPYGKP